MNLGSVASPARVTSDYPKDRVSVSMSNSNVRRTPAAGFSPEDFEVAEFFSDQIPNSIVLMAKTDPKEETCKVAQKSLPRF